MNKLPKAGQRVLGWLLCFIVMFTSAPMTALAQTGLLMNIGEEVQLLGAQSENQSVSEPETVGINAYSGSARSISFDDNWKFNLGDAANAEKVVFDDSTWRSVNVPHDYSIEQDYTTFGEAESGYLPGGIGWYRKSFTVEAAWKDKKTIMLDFGGVYMNAEVWLNGQKLGVHPYGYTTFAFDITDKLNFEGQNILAVKVNNNIPTSRFYSGSGIYRSVNMLVSDKVHVARYGTTITTPDLESTYTGDVTVNIETVIQNDTDADQQVEVVHTIIDKNGVAAYSVTKAAITAEPEEEAAGNLYTVQTAGEEPEQTDKTVSAGEEGIKAVRTNDKMVVVSGQSIYAHTISQTVNQPKLWSLDNPNLYTVKTELRINGEVVDTTYTDFGFRWTTFDRDTGFALNGEKMKLKGVCMHHDQGSLGAKAYYRAIERQVEMLLEMGCNSIRVTHNPAANELIEICNRLGMLLIDESFDAWDSPKNGNRNEYAIYFNETIGADNTIAGGAADMTWAEFDVKEMVSRGKNAPSIIMWSLGNEVMEGNAGPFSHYDTLAAQLAEWVAEIDPTRPSTTGDNKFKANNAESIEINNALTAAGGTVGLNYCGGSQYDNAYNNHESWIIYGAETASHINSRGVYDIKGQTSRSDRQRTAYDQSCVGWGKVASDAWYDVITRDYVAGEYVWTGFDYIGEPTPWNGTGSGSVGAWPAPKSSYFGIIDTAGFPKDNYYLYQSLWNEKVNTLHVLPAWNEDVVSKDGNGNVEVVVYSDAASVELFFTPKGTEERRSLGKKTFTEKTTAAGHTYQVYEGEDKYSAEHKNLYMGWSVPYADGKLTAVAYDKSGNVISNTTGRSEVETTGAADKLELTADRTEIKADGKDLSYITVDVTDFEGNIIPDAKNHIVFNVEGDGKIVGVDNGNAIDHDSHLLSERDAWAGKALVIVQSTKQAGQFTLTAASRGIETGSVTVTTTPVGSSGEKRMESYEIARSYYVKLGTMPVLPSAVKVNYSDGSQEEKAVVWEPVTDQLINTVGSFVVNGTIEGTEILVSVSVNMLSEVIALLNYSTGVVLGDKPSLPAARPAVLADGTITDASFPVTWEDVNAIEFPEGITEISGTSTIFGKNYQVSAFVRAQKETETKGSNVAGKALKLFDNIPDDLKSDTLEAVIDGRTEGDPNARAIVNPTIWTNYYSAQAGNETAAITMTFATAQSVGSLKLYHYVDAFSACMPEKVELFWSQTENDEDFKPLLFTQSEPVNQDSNVKVVDYTFDDIVEAVAIKIILTNSTEEVKAAHANVGLSEIELYRHEMSFELNSSEAISEWKINGAAANNTQLSNRVFRTQAVDADIEVASDQNAAYTILPAHNGIIRILTESEDHKNRGEYQVQLNGVEDIEAGDDSADYPVGQLTVEAGNYQPQEPPERVLDNKPDTLWHTSWNTGTPLEQRWITLILQEETELRALRYLPRNNSGGPNGRVTKYTVEVSSDKTEWTEVSSGSWANSTGWKVAMFDRAVTAKYVRLTGVECVTDAHPYMSAAEIRVVKNDTAAEDLSGAVITLPREEYSHTGSEIKPRPSSVVLGEKNLVYGLDYTLSYENNVNEGEALLRITGVNGYSGTADKAFRIVAPVEYTVTFESNGGSAVAAVNVPEGKRVARPAAPTKEKARFGGWYTDEELTTSWNFVRDTVNADMTLYAKWIANEPQKYIVNFDSNGGTAVNAVILKEESLLAEPTRVRKQNYTLQGWYKDPEFKEQWNFESDKVSGNMTLYAKWVLKFQEGIYVLAVPEYTYTGNAYKPELVVYDGETVLTYGKDYTVSYKNNINVWDGTDPSKRPQAIVKGKGNYSGKTSIPVYLDILPRSIEDEAVSVTTTDALNSNKDKKLNVPFTAKYGKKTLNKTKDLTIRYERDGEAVEQVDKAGSYTLIAEGKGNYTGTIRNELVVVDAANKKLTSKLSMKLSKGSVTYTGEAITTEHPALNIVIKDGRTVLYDSANSSAEEKAKFFEGFDILYTNNREIGTASVKVAAKAVNESYAGSKSLNFKIVGTAITKAKFEQNTFKAKTEFNGQPQEQEAMQLFIMAGGQKKVLAEGTDYTVRYSSNIMAGKAVVEIIGRGAYSGVMKKTFTIAPVKLAMPKNTTNVSQVQGAGGVLSVTMAAISYEQNRAGVSPKPELTYTTDVNGEEVVYSLVEGIDYTLSYKNNKNISNDRRIPAVNVKLKGNFSGTLNALQTFTITPKALSGNGIRIEAADMPYKKTAKEYKAKVTVYDNGAKLTAKDFVIQSYADNNNEGFAEGSAKTAAVTISAKEGGDYTGTATVSFRISEKLISKANIKVAAKEYTGAEVKLTSADIIQATIGSGKSKVELEEGKDYRIIEDSYVNNVKSGTAKVTVEGLGEYAGTKVITFKILPKGLLELLNKLGMGK